MNEPGLDRLVLKGLLIRIEEGAWDSKSHLQVCGAKSYRGATLIKICCLKVTETKLACELV